MTDKVGAPRPPGGRRPRQRRSAGAGPKSRSIECGDGRGRRQRRPQGHLGGARQGRSGPSAGQARRPSLPSPPTPLPQVVQRELAAGDIIDRLLKDFNGQVLTNGQQVVFELQGLNLRLVVGSLLVSDPAGENRDVPRAFLRDSTAFIFTNAGGSPRAALLGWGRRAHLPGARQQAAPPCTPPPTPHPPSLTPTPGSRPGPHQGDGPEGLRHQPAVQVPHPQLRVPRHRRPGHAVRVHIPPRLCQPRVPALHPGAPRHPPRQGGLARGGGAPFVPLLYRCGRWPGPLPGPTAVVGAVQDCRPSRGSARPALRT